MERRKSSRVRGWILCATLVVGVQACTPAPTRFVDPEADLPFYEKVAVMPFASLSGDPLAGEKVGSVFFSEVLRLGFEQVMEPGQFSSAMTRVRGGTPYSNPWSSEDLSKLVEETGVQGVFLGTVRDYSFSTTGRESYPLLSLEVRFVDAATGRLVWSASQTRRGGPAPPLLGFTATRTMGELTTEVCRELVKTMPKKRP
jgi:TolB-like protein